VPQPTTLPPAPGKQYRIKIIRNMRRKFAAKQEEG
jgi:hypothetical protein